MARRSRRLVLGIVVAIALISGAGLLSIQGSTPARAEDSTAQEPSVVREVLSKRTECSMTYLLSDGTFRTVFYQAPIHFKDDDGDWQEINTSLVPSAGVDAYTTAAAPVEVTVKDEGAGCKPIEVETAGYLVTMNLLGYAESDKLVLGDTAIYTDVAPDTDVTYTALGDGVKEVISLASAAAPDTFTYRLTHAGLELRRDEAGQWALHEPGSELPLFLIGAVNACDSSLDEAGEPAWCDAASMTVSPGDGASTITYRVPRAWLSDPARVWPVKIDPSLGTRAPTDLPLALGGPVSATYDYTPDRRLATASVGGVAGKYVFDGAGNLSFDTEGAVTTSFTYDAANRLTQTTDGAATTVYGWNATNGWRVSQGPVSAPTQVQYTYVKSGTSYSNGRMTRYQNSSTGVDATYAYDASGQRVKSSVTQGGTTTTTSFT